MTWFLVSHVYTLSTFYEWKVKSCILRHHYWFFIHSTSSTLCGHGISELLRTFVPYFYEWILGFNGWFSVPYWVRGEKSPPSKCPYLNLTKKVCFIDFSCAFRMRNRYHFYFCISCCVRRDDRRTYALKPHIYAQK